MIGGKDLTQYLNQGVEKLVADIIKSTFQNPKETKFLLDYQSKNKKNLQLRSNFEVEGLHVPAFLISSISDTCNLFCKGCYARINGICGNPNSRELLTADEWTEIFSQATTLGVSFNLLAGGEPLMRRDVIEAAAKFPGILSAIFTNGILIDNTFLNLFDQYRNLVPIISIEGGKQKTDARRGSGAFEKTEAVMKRLNQEGILFGTSITITTDNLEEVTSQQFLSQLKISGCKLVFFVEYVPFEPNTRHLLLGSEERKILDTQLNNLRMVFPEMLFLSFPGDEKEMGGCLAAGRGFFHINPYGDAEPCPFSPYSDCSLKNHTLVEVLQSPFFKKLQDEKLVGGEHDGGCALFEHESIVKACLYSQINFNNKVSTS